MNLTFLNSNPSHSLLKFSRSSLKSKTFFTHAIKSSPISSLSVPARDRVIDFGKHRGRMLGTLPSNYLKWISKNLRARDFEDWAKLADEVLIDPVYRDRIEWELAEKLLSGDVSSSSLPRSDSAVSELLEISQRFGWDNDDKLGWKRIDFALLGTSNGGRIPRISDRGAAEREIRSEKEKSGGSIGEESKGGGSSRRRERRERSTLKRSTATRTEKVEWLGFESNGGGRGGSKSTIDQDQTAGIGRNPFPGRETLLKNVLNRRRS